jgi:hypothetical protein
MKNFNDDQEYYGDWEYTTNSQLGYVKRSPAYYWKMRNGAKIDGAALRFGSLVHTMILEPEKVSENFVVFDAEDRPEQAKGMTSKANKAWKLQLDLDCKEGRKYLMTVDQFELAQKLTKKLYDCPEVKAMLDNCETEVPKTWIDFNTMSKCKGKADIIIDGGDMIVDIKTTGKDVKDFRRSAYNFAYHRQAAFYLDGFNAKEFVFVVIESNAPHQIGIFRCSENFLEQGRQEYIELLEDKKKYCETVALANNHIIHEEL